MTIELLKILILFNFSLEYPPKNEIKQTKNAWKELFEKYSNLASIDVLKR